MRICSLLILYLACLLPEVAQAFPELIRYGYSQCTACHVSPAGGGVLTKYGRELAADVLSTWSYTNESQFLHSKVGKDLADLGYLAGGDVRAIQIHSKSPSEDQAKFFLMMADFQAAYQTDHFTAVISVGQVEDPMERPGIHGNFNATEYYGFLKFSDELGLRAGRFMPAFGINLPDHTLAIKQMLGFVPQFEFDSVEANYLSEHWTVLAAAGSTVPDTDPSIQENVRSLNISYSFLNRMRAGLSYWDGNGAQVRRHILGANAILGFTEKFYSMDEIDAQYESSQNSIFALSQWAYEVYRGVTPYVQYQHEQDDLKDPTTLKKTYGIGCHFYPRPHFEFSGEWNKIFASSVWSDEAFFMAHYYF